MALSNLTYENLTVAWKRGFFTLIKFSVAASLAMLPVEALEAIINGLSSRHDFAIVTSGFNVETLGGILCTFILIVLFLLYMPLAFYCLLSLLGVRLEQRK